MISGEVAFVNDTACEASSCLSEEKSKDNSCNPPKSENEVWEGIGIRNRGIDEEMYVGLRDAEPGKTPDNGDLSANRQISVRLKSTVARRISIFGRDSLGKIPYSGND
ncbi:unnamed protein product [Cylicocyclus nassatus]|uniref:Uncharacterized protein n=1 Tax=Cylicocyclus nassatus TaxID=53992 RepID=A0AA36HFC0_CYLNA|nr:unnamed protein product [Cylicocyclus nassatus]